jgi:hypothetical protein
MAQKQGSELFTMVTIVENGEVKNRHFHRIEVYDRKSNIHVMDGKNLPDYVRFETDYRRVHGNVMQLVAKKKKESRPWTPIDTAIALSSLNLALWIISMI